MSLIAVMTTVGSRVEAQKIARKLVEGRLAACVHVSVIDSCYEWDGELQFDPEFRLLIKTTRERYQDVEAAILELHSYDVPAVVAFDLTASYQAYADWILDSVS